eukprot:1174323-Rhodomonas_salina.1
MSRDREGKPCRGGKEREESRREGGRQGLGEPVLWRRGAAEGRARAVGERGQESGGALYTFIRRASTRGASVTDSAPDRQKHTGAASALRVTISLLKLT